MKRINERAWEVFGIYGRVCESCSGAIALSLLQALAMFGCLEKREAGGLTLYCILTFIAVVATIGFFASLISIGRTIHIQSEGHKVAEFGSVRRSRPEDNVAAEFLAHVVCGGSRDRL